MSEADTIREALAAQLHDVYQAEAKRQGDVRHHDDYADLSEPIKDYDRALADFILERDAALERRAEQAERDAKVNFDRYQRASRMAEEAERHTNDERLRLLHELLATLDRDFAQVITPADAWSESLIRVGALKARAEQAEAALRTRETRIKAEWYRHGLHDTAGYTDREVETMLRGFGIAMFAALAATTPGDQERREQMGKDYEASAADDLAISQSIIRATTPGEPR